MTLFYPDATYQVDPVETPDFYNIYAREQKGQPEGWRWFVLDSSKKSAPDGFLKIEGAVAPSEGRDAWRNRERGTESTIFVNLKEFDAWKLAYAASQGKCVKCWNSGKVWCGWNKDKGNAYRPCNCGVSA